MKASFGFVLALLGLAFCATLADEGVRIEKDIAYLGPDRGEKGDLYLPAKHSERLDLYQQASPVTHADKNDPPILILHGTNDETVPVEQAEKLAAALKKAGVVTELVIIPDATHGFHLQPKQRNLRPLVIGFFGKHLKATAKTCV
ncbi:MAG: prolyl oligopeptidase family serine peptidase [Verrucomicrobiae bacterium]|nr:prolyl oligopeptidase family serine peptidase [Verrucomicrobiae bacterium]